MGVKKTNNGLYHIIQIMLLVGTLVVANVLFTMITKKHIWSRQDALNSQIASSIVDTVTKGKRGTIYDRNYNVIAQEVNAYTIVVILPDYDDQGNITGPYDENGNPLYVTDTAKTSRSLAKILDNTKRSTLQSIMDTAIDKGLAQTELGTGTKRLSKEVKEKIEKLDLTGITFKDDVSRNYPVSPFSSNLIGFASYDEEQQGIVGKMGLEQSLNKILTGKDGKVQYQQTVTGSVLPGTTTVYKEAENGDNVVLTLDFNLQETVESVMKKTMEDNNAQKAWCCVMEVETGEILAWASYPTFDQNHPTESPSYTDNVSEMSFEPGSVMKSITYATAIDTGVFPENTTFRAGEFNYKYDAATGKIVRTISEVDGYPTIRDALGHDYGTITFETGLAYSSNVGICELLANYVNYNDFESYLKAFGFFQATDIPYVNESVGWESLDSVIDYLSTGFGQASSVTVLQLMQAYSAIFNDGNMVRPYVVKQIEDGDTNEVLKSYGTEITGTPISKETADKMKDLLKNVLSEGAGGERFAIDGVDMMAKTGTGEYYDEETGAYSTSIYSSSIMAAAPYDDPEIMVYWGMLGPNYVNYSASYFQTIMQAALIAEGISGGDTEKSETTGETWNSYTMPSLKNHTNEYVKNKLSSISVPVLYIGDGVNVIDQYPEKDTVVTSNDKIFILTDGKNVTMPDMTGWTYKDVKIFCELSGISFEASGQGTVSEQSIASGQSVDSKTKIVVKLA